MSTPFANPWSNPHNPVDMFRRYKRRRAKQEAQKAPAPDHRTQEVDDNRTYASKTEGNAQAQQSYFDVMTGPWADFFTPPTDSSSAAPRSKWPRAKTDPTEMPKPSPFYDPTDW